MREKFRKFNLEPNTDYENSSLYIEACVDKRFGGAWVRLMKTTAKSIKYLNANTKSGYGRYPIEKVEEVRIYTKVEGE